MNPREVLTREASRPDAVVRYGDHDDHVLDLHLPPTRTPVREPASLVFLLHGGFWRQEFDRTHARPLAQALAADGFAVVTPEYRRTGGDGGWPMTFDDVADAFTRLRLLDDVVPERVGFDDVTLVGHSAGGHLAMWLGLRSRTLAGPSARRVVALAPVADLHDAHQRDLGDGAVRTLMGGDPADLPHSYAGADPRGMLPGDVDVVVLHGDADRQVPVAMSRALPGVEYVELPGADHFALIDPLSSVWPHVRDAVRAPGPDVREPM